MKNFKTEKEKLIEMGRFLKDIREKKGYSMNQVEIYTGLNRKEIMMLENGEKQKPNPLYLKSLAKFYKIEIQKLLKIIGYIDEIREPSNITDDVYESFIQIPLYGMASAGSGLIEFDENIEEMEYISIPKLNGNVKKRDFSTKVKGDSMEPYYHDGDVIVVDVADSDIRTLNGKEALIYIGEEKYLKRVFFEEGTGVLYLKSYNPAYPDIKISSEGVENIECKGTISMVISMRNNRRI